MLEDKSTDDELELVDRKEMIKSNSIENKKDP